MCLSYECKHTFLSLFPLIACSRHHHPQTRTETQDVLKQMRKIDDNIVYAINKSIPSSTSRSEDEAEASTRCRDLHLQLTTSYQNRENLIKDCIRKSSERLSQLKQQQESLSSSRNVGASAAGRRLRSEQSQLRLLQKELNIEEVIQERSTKILHDKCRSYYRPPPPAT